MKVSKEEITQNVFMQLATDVAFTQMITNAGFKKYGQAVVAAMVK